MLWEATLAGSRGLFAHCALPRKLSYVSGSEDAIGASRGCRERCQPARPLLSPPRAPRRALTSVTITVFPSTFTALPTRLWRQFTDQLLGPAASAGNRPLQLPLPPPPAKVKHGQPRVGSDRACMAAHPPRVARGQPQGQCAFEPRLRRRQRGLARQDAVLPRCGGGSFLGTSLGWRARQRLCVRRARAARARRVAMSCLLTSQWTGACFVARLVSGAETSSQAPRGPRA
jgi:hypothetical protein